MRLLSQFVLTSYLFSFFVLNNVLKFSKQKNWRMKDASGKPKLFEKFLVKLQKDITNRPDYKEQHQTEFNIAKNQVVVNFPWFSHCKMVKWIQLKEMWKQKTIQMKNCHEKKQKIFSRASNEFLSQQKLNKSQAFNTYDE